MADEVQFRLERMAPELEDLHKRNLFTRPELDAIARTRRDFEFRLKRPSPLKSDYLSYINYETSLDALRELRKRKIVGEWRKERKGKLWARSVSDSAGVKRVLGVYRLAVMRNKGDLDLWFRYLEFCRERRHGRMKEALAQAIRYHPTVPGLWIYAASYEFDHNLNVQAARALMQSGLRSCPKSEELWIQYLRMELTYLNKLKARKEALGQSVPKLETGTDSWKEENKDLFMSLNDEKETEKEIGEEREKYDVFFKHGVKMLEIIYKQAVEKIRESLELRKKFLEILRGVNLGDTNQLEEEILNDMKRDFEKNEEFWDWFAKSQGHFGHLVSDDSVTKAIKIYEEALEKLATEKMYSLYAKFFREILQNISDSNLSEKYTENLLNLYRRSDLTNSLNEGLACDYLTFYVKSGKLNEAKDLSERFLSLEKFSKSGEIWHLRVSVEGLRIKLGFKNFDDIFRLIKRALDNLDISQAEDLFLTGLRILGDDKDYFEKMVKLANFSMGKSKGGGISVARAIIGLVLVKKGISKARDIYNRFVFLTHPSVELFKYCVEIEFNLALSGNDKNALLNARKLYEKALGFYAHDLDLWRDYYSMETKVGEAKVASNIYERARKILKVDLTIL